MVKFYKWKEATMPLDGTVQGLGDLKFIWSDLRGSIGGIPISSWNSVLQYVDELLVSEEKKDYDKGYCKPTQLSREERDKSF